MADMIKVLNTIRANASKEYQSTVPVATRENFATVGSTILTYSLNNNEFIDTLINRIALTIVNSRDFQNPLSVLQKGDMPLGEAIQEIYTNPATSQQYSGTSTDLLKVFKPDTKTATYKLNRKAKFTVSVSQEQLQSAFVSMGDFETFLNSIVVTMQSGDEIEQFELTKQLMSMAYEDGTITEVNINTDTGLTWTQINALSNPDEYVSKWLVKQIKTYSKLMKFPSTQFNKFAYLKGGTVTPVKTWTPIDKQVVILPSVVETNMEVEVLAYTFQIDKAEIKNRTLSVDSFNGSPILGLLCDEACFHIKNRGRWIKSFDNGDTLTTTYWLHHWQLFGYSVLANSIAFTYLPDSVTLATGSLGTLGDSKITGLTASTAYNVTVNGEKVTSMTTNSSGELTGLSNSDVYFVEAIE
jgi:hypothetical protein